MSAKWHENCKRCSNVFIEGNWSSAGDVGVAADAGILVAVCEWLWAWWRPSCNHVGQVQKCWETSVYSAIVSVLVVASDSDWLDGIPHFTVGETPTEEADWTWVHTLLLADLHICTSLVVISLCTCTLYFRLLPKYLYWYWSLILKYLVLVLLLASQILSVQCMLVSVMLISKLVHSVIIRTVTAVLC